MLGDIASICGRYGVRKLASDQWAADAIRDLASRRGLRLESEATTAASKLAMFEQVRAVVANA